MAVILQEVVGNQYGDRYYPAMSGVARSLNYYPIGDEKAEEGIVNLALGLGKYIVDGGMTLRFSPYHPNQVLQTSEMEIALKETQTRFYALDLRNAGHDFSIDDGFNLLKLHVKEAEKDGALNYIASTYDPYDQIIRDWSLSRRTQSHHLCQHPATRRLPAAPHLAAGFEIRSGRDAPSRRDRVCRQFMPVRRPASLSVADTSDGRCTKPRCWMKPYRHSGRPFLVDVPTTHWDTA